MTLNNEGKPNLKSHEKSSPAEQHDRKCSRTFFRQTDSGIGWKFGVKQKSEWRQKR